jgi:hypothetical protein
MLATLPGPTPDKQKPALLNRPTTLFEEMISAARGVAAVIAGDRRAPAHFDFSRRGLAGSFIAFLAGMVLNAYLPSLSSDPNYTALPATRLLTVSAVLFAAQIGFSALVLRQLNRLDGFVPYLVADNWTTFFVAALSSLLALLGLSSDFVVVIVGLATLVIEINIARLIVTLKPLQIAMFLIAQIVGVAIGLIVIWQIFPSSDLVAAGTTPLQ